MTALSLYSLSDEVERLLSSEDAFDAETGELSPDLVAALDATKDKAANVCAYILNRDAEIVAIEAHEAKIAAHKAVIVRKQERLREYLAMNMKRTGITEISANDGTFKAKLYIERDASVEIYDEKQIPAQFMTTPKPPEPKPSKAEIGKALKAGTDVPGARIVKRDRLTIS
ncbi:hypothetical protein E5S69_31680 [Cupriavidus necator]|uniref:siphovirus Gp157 family protein n=1 Tax=Cupriavidus necator TaxID=106590 RepID=UPI00148F88C3|nr:siphovirus Gp157 family protein [Cupriavidus necator]NOV28049.1 hypothetical protein [Cupriavidus necator]